MPTSVASALLKEETRNFFGSLKAVPVDAGD